MTLSLMMVYLVYLSLKGCYILYNGHPKKNRGGQGGRGGVGQQLAREWHKGVLGNQEGEVLLGVGGPDAATRVWLQ